MKAAERDEDLHGLFDVPEWETLLLETGYSKPLQQLGMEDQDSIVSFIADYHCIVKVKAAMDQFKQGLDAGGVLTCIQQHAYSMKHLFCYEPCNLPKCRYISKHV